MYLLTCGRSSVSARDAHSKSTPTFDQMSDLEGSSASVAPLGVAAQRQPRGSIQRLDNAMMQYDSMATRLKSASRTDFPPLWTTGTRRNTKRGEQLTSASGGDIDEVVIPDLHVGVYQTFCQPQNWSPVFASPGDFTIRMEAATERRGELVYRIAMICCSVQAVREQGTETSTQGVRRKSYLKTVERTDSELTKFAETMALRHLGHKLMDKLPTLVLSVLTTNDQLEEHGGEVAQFLCYLLSITTVGYNGLVDLTEPVAKNLFVREFLDLSLSFGDPGMVSTSSCDARLERAADIRSLPNAWFAGGAGAAHSRSFSVAGTASFDASRQSHTPSTEMVPRSLQGKCFRFVRPSRWKQECQLEGAFTVEIAGVTILDGKARYTICVLFYTNGKQEMTSVDRRFSEFDAMVNHVERKLRALPVRNHFPTKTLFRYLSIAYLERRAAYLQRFLEKLLQMRFLGVLDQEISMAAEPNVRKFLQLPAVQWGITPWNASGTPRRRRRTAQRGSPESSAFSTNTARMYTDSPSSSDSIGMGPYDIVDTSTPQDRFRSESM